MVMILALDCKVSSLYSVPAACDSSELQSWLRQRVPDINFHCPLDLL